MEHPRLIRGLMAAVFGWGAGFSAIAQDPCLVCGADPAQGRADVEYRGAMYPVCEDGCKEIWRQAGEAGELDAIVEKIEPRAALFQGDSRFLNPAFQRRHPLGLGWMVAGIWVLLAVASAGLASALAVGGDRSPPAAFWIGWLLPVIGVGLVGILPKKKATFAVRGVKIPTTHAEILCGGCGRSLHPSARRCPGCGDELTPVVESEVTKVNL